MAVITVNPGDNLQTKVNSAQPGDFVELHPSVEWDGTLVLPNTPGMSALAPITIRSSAYGQLPNGRIGQNVISDTIPESALMPKIRTLGGGSYGAAIVSAANAGYWKLDGLNITDNATSTATIAALLDFGLTNSGAHDITVDRCWIHAKETGSDYNRLVQRGVWAEGSNITIKRSYTYLIGYHNPDSVGGQTHVQMDTCAFLSVGGPGPLTIQNNFISVWWNGIFLGGGDTAPAHTASLTSSSTSSATFSNTAGLVSGVVLRLAFTGEGTWNNTTKVLTRTSGTLDSGDGGNWEGGSGTAIILTPAGGGSPSVNTRIGGDIVGNSIPIGGNNGSVGASGNYVWTVYQTAKIDSVVGSTVNYTPYGVDELRHAPEAAAWCVGDEGLICDINLQGNTFKISSTFADDVYANKGYQPKGWIEIKNAKRLYIDDNEWLGHPSQIVIYSNNQNGQAPWITTDYVYIRKNLVYPDTGHIEGVRAAFVMNAGSYLATVTPSTYWLVENNVVRNLRSFLQTIDANGAVIKHNTVLNTEPQSTGYNNLVAGIGPSSNWQFRDNIGVYVLYGMQPFGDSFANTWPSSSFLTNLIVDSNAIGFSTSEWGANSILTPIPDSLDDIGFTDLNGNVLSLSPSSIYKNTGSDGTDPGVDWAVFAAAHGDVASRTAATGRIATTGRTAATGRAAAAGRSRA